MSELDEVFGPRRAILAPVSRKPTAWPDAPVNLRPLLDRFEKLTGGQFKLRRKWHVKMAHDYYEEVKTSDADLFERAYRDLEQGGMTIKSVKSMMNKAKWMRRKRVDWDSNEEIQKHADSWNFEEEQ